MYKALIIDDERPVANDLNLMIEAYCPKLEVIGIAQTSQSALELIRDQAPQIVFLDIQIDDKNGIELLRDLKQVAFEVIFVTAHEQYAIEAFKLSAIDYLLKPVDPDELIQAVDKAIEKLGVGLIQSQLHALVQNLGQELRPKKIVLTDHDGVHILDVSQILWCHANGSYTEFQMEDGTVKVTSKHLKTYEGLLQKHGFYRIHRSYLVNGDSILKVDRSDSLVFMKNNHRLPVSIAPDVLKIILNRLQS